MEDYTKILKLDLSNQSLRKLSTDFSKYTNLEELNLSNNDLQYLPESLKECKSLRKINISKNQLTDLPSFFADYVNIEELNIGSNSIKGIPDWLWKLSSLKKLNLYGLAIGGLPKEIGNLRRLEELKVGKIQMRTLPDTIGYLENLEELSLESNTLSKLPKAFTRLKKLKKLSLKLNKFQVFSKDIFEVKNLEYLDISGNSIKAIPKQIRTLKKLSYLNISENRIRDIPNYLLEFKFKESNFHFKNNAFSPSTKRRLTKLFEEKRKTPQPKKKQFRQVSFNDGKKKNAVNKRFITVAAIVITVLLGLISLLIPNKASFSKGVRDGEDRTFDSALANAKEVLVYTNDIDDIEFTMNANLVYSKLVFSKTQRWYNVHLNTGGRKIRNVIKVYENALPETEVKKFSVIAYYKMNEKEKTDDWSIRRDRRNSQENIVRSSILYDFAYGVVDMDELDSQSFKTKQYPILSEINLNRKEYYFYFTPLNANVSIEEFLDAVDKFKKLFIKKGNPETSCFFNKIGLQKEGY